MRAILFPVFTPCIPLHNLYSPNPLGTRSSPISTLLGVNAHNHQHLFCLRIDANVDGPANTVFAVDAVPSDAPVGSPENYYGNAFYAKRTKLATTGLAMTDYDGATSRTWDISNESSLHPYSGKPASYKLVSREVPRLLPKEGSLVWKRAGFARHAVHVTKCESASQSVSSHTSFLSPYPLRLPYLGQGRRMRPPFLLTVPVPDADDQLWPAGRHVPQTSGEPSSGLPEWIGDGSASVDNTDVVLWHTFGVVHIPAPEDFPVMPVEPMTLLLRPRNFFKSNPVLDVPPSYAATPSQLLAGGKGVLDAADKTSQLAFANGQCCAGETNGASTNGANGTNGV